MLLGFFAFLTVKVKTIAYMREEDKKERLRRSICGGRGIEDRMFWVRGRGRVLGELGAGMG